MPFFLSSSETPIVQMVVLFMCFVITQTLPFSSFLFLFPRLDNLNQPILSLLILYFACQNMLWNPSDQLFQLLYFYVQDFYLLPFSNFFLFIDIFYLVKRCSHILVLHVVSFFPLNIFEIAYLKSSSKSYPQGPLLLIAFFPVYEPQLLVSLNFFENLAVGGAHFSYCAFLFGYVNHFFLSLIFSIW